MTGNTTITRLLLTGIAAPLLLAAAEPTGELRVDLSGVRNAKGELFLCLSANPGISPTAPPIPPRASCAFPPARPTASSSTRSSPASTRCR
jgi:hypothetical protein